MPEHFHFVQPLWFWCLIPLALLVWRVRKPGSAENAWRRVCDPRLLPWLLVKPGGRATRLPVWLLAVAWLLAVVALADPVWEKQPQPVYRAQDARVVVLDLSRSMLSPDLKPSRLVRARYKVADILKHSEEGQTGLVVFAGDAFTVSPLTSDADTIQSLLTPLEPDLMPVQGSRADLGLEKAGELLAQAGIRQADVLLIADGFTGRRAIDVAERLRAQDYRVSVLGVGTDQGAPLPDGRGAYVRDSKGNIVVAQLDSAALRELAEAGGGRYATISADGADLERVLNPVTPQLDSQVEQTELQTDIWQSRGPWLVLVLLPLAALVFRRGWLLSLPVMLAGAVASPQPAMAFGWDELWSRRDQQAHQALQSGNLEQAQQLARDPLRLGTAEYRAGNYRQALESFTGASGADADYNRGNALAQLGQYRDAIAAYDQALDARPGMADAIHNKAAVEKLLQQQQQQQQQEQEQEQEQQDSRDESGQSPESADQQQDANGQDMPRQDPSQSAQDQGEQAPSSADDKASPDNENGQNDGQQASAADSRHPDTGAEPDRQDPEQSNGEPPGDGRHEQDAARQSQAADGQQNPDETQEQADRASAEDPLSSEEQQAAEQWLQRIPDDPGGLLRRKFLYQYRERAARADTEVQQAW